MSYAAAPILAKQGGSTIPVTTWVAHPVTSGILKITYDSECSAAHAVGSIMRTTERFDDAKWKE